MTTEQDQAAFIEAFSRVSGYPVKLAGFAWDNNWDHAQVWQAALAYAREGQAEREKRLVEAERIATNQAESVLLWMPAATEREAMLQRALRQLSAAVEGTDYYGIPLAAFNAQEK